MPAFPSFDPEEVELLIAAVERTLAHLREANERIGGKDAELIATGSRYAVLLQKLQAVARR